MIKGLYAAASAMVAGETQQKVLSHNIANLDTPGFKQAMLTLARFETTPVVYSPGNITKSNQETYIGDLGLGVQTTPETTDFSEGPLNSTGQPLDVAINGSGFFRVRTPDGERYTRDGRFNRDATGQLTTIDGFQVLNSSGQPIKLPEGSVSIAPDGTISVNNVTAGQLGLAAFLNPAAELTRDQSNTYTAAAAPTGKVDGQVRQGYLESSNANEAQLMAQLDLVSKSYEAAQQMVQNQDELLGKTISQLGQA
jgi:flagellar basal-body rod protein FlgF